VTETVHPPLPAWDESDRRLATDLDRLAHAEASSAPAGMESRVADRSAPALREAPIPFARVLARSPMRIAAAAALLAGGAIALVWLNRQATTPAAPEAPVIATTDSDLDGAVAAWLTVAALDDQDPIAAELDLLYAETARLGEGFEWQTGPDLTNGRGSM